MSRKWVQCSGNSDLIGLSPTKLHKSKRICEDHFYQHDIFPSGRLKPNACPVMFAAEAIEDHQPSTTANSGESLSASLTPSTMSPPTLPPPPSSPSVVTLAASISSTQSPSNFPSPTMSTSSSNFWGVRQPPNRDTKTDLECAEVRQQIRNLCLSNRDLTPCDVLQAVTFGAPPCVQKYIDRYKETIKRDICLWRSCTTADGDGDSAIGTKAVLKRPRKNKKEEGKDSKASTSTSSQDDSSSSMPQASDQGPSTSGGFGGETFIKKEVIKDELILEDYEMPSEVMEYEQVEGCESIESETEDGKVEESTTSSVTETPFETIICGADNAKIKQEIFEDETDTYNSSLNVDPIASWSEPSVQEPSDSLSAKNPQWDFPANIESPNDSSTTAGRVRSPLNKTLKQISKTKMKISKRFLTAGSAVPIQRCKICVNEVFSSPSALVEHCIMKHSDASSNFLPVDSSISEESSDTTGGIGLHTTTVASLPGYSATTLPDFNDAPPSGHSAATTPGQPPHHFIPPYISTCDVFDGVFVSLRYIPAKNRKAARDKIVELVKFFSMGKVDPTLVKFCVLGK